MGLVTIAEARPSMHKLVASLMTSITNCELRVSIQAARERLGAVTFKIGNAVGKISAAWAGSSIITIGTL